MANSDDSLKHPEGGRHLRLRLDNYFQRVLSPGSKPESQACFRQPQAMGNHPAHTYSTSVYQVQRCSIIPWLLLYELGIVLSLYQNTQLTDKGRLSVSITI